jgi:hypothetical protein
MVLLLFVYREGPLLDELDGMILECGRVREHDDIER